MTKADQVLRGGMEGSVTGVPPACQRPARVLVVDHESAACELQSLIFGPPAFRCATASNGEEALAALQRWQFDAGISDLHIPDISGMELLAEVRRCYPHRAFLVTTGVDDVDVCVWACHSAKVAFAAKRVCDWPKLSPT